MAFYPDELSPIDRIRSLGQPADSLPDIGPLKNRRQWKSLVLGKKDMGLNNFATIAEEKEEEISSDGSQGTTNSNKGSAGGSAVNAGVVANRKITFPKPRKYITSRVSDRKEEASLRGVGNAVPFAPLATSVLKEVPANAELGSSAGSPKASLTEAKLLPKAKKSKETIVPAQEFVQNFALSETPIETQWNEAVMNGTGPTGWSRANAEKLEEKKRASGGSKAPLVSEGASKEAKAGKKKNSPVGKKSPKAKEEPSQSSKGKQKADKGKTLNMKEVVNVYKNLAYGSKEEIKSFVENLSLVKDESRAENDKNLLSMMNLKALENKIKSFAKKSGKNSDVEASTSYGKKPKSERSGRKSRKAHIERLARHKVVKVPAVLNSNYLNTSGESGAPEKASEQRGRRPAAKDKEPWKYVGMESALDKTYFVYPAYPPSVNLKKASKARKTCAKATEKPAKEKKATSDVAAAKGPKPEPKVKAPQVVVKPNLFFGGGPRSYSVNLSRSASIKSINRPSATTVCTVEFRPSVGQKAEAPPPGATDQSLLVYLHGTKAIHVKSPYSDKQFSRVKFFRKDDKGIMPLIKGLGPRPTPPGHVSVRNLGFPTKLTRVRSLDLLDFDEDIQNITDFLRSQDSSDRQRPDQWQPPKRPERERCPTPTPPPPKDHDAAASRYQRRQRKTTATHEHHRHHHHYHHHHHHHHSHHRQPHYHQHGTSQPTLSPDSIIDEISKNIQHLQYLPDTEDNRKMIARFFDELDHRIEASRKGALTLDRLPSPSGPEPFRPIPILGY